MGRARLERAVDCVLPSARRGADARMDHLPNQRRGARAARRRAGMTDIVLVAAVAENGVIGRDNALPWRLKSDLRHFRALTIGKPVLMGRKTFLSLARPLVGRTNIVVSRTPEFAAAGAVAAWDLENALTVGHGDALRRNVPEVMVIGGADIFAALLPRAIRLEITRVHA